MLIQAGLIFSVILFGGTTKQMKANAYDILAEKVVSRKNDLENEMIQRWSNVSGPMQTILELTGDVLERYQVGPEALEINADVTNELLRQVSSPLMALMRTNSVSGAFIAVSYTHLPPLPAPGARPGASAPPAPVRRRRPAAPPTRKDRESRHTH